MNFRVQRILSVMVGASALTMLAAPVDAAAYQDTVISLEPAYYYELNEQEPGPIVDTMGNAPDGTLNGDYSGGGPAIGVPGPDFLLFQGAWTESGWDKEFVGIEIPITGLGEDNTAHFSNNSGHIDLGQNDLFGAPTMSVAMFAKGGGNAQGGDRLFTNNLADPTRSFQIVVGNSGIVVSFDPTQDSCTGLPDEDCAHRTLKLPGQGDATGSGAGADTGLIGTANGWWHIVATTEGETALERAANLRFYLNGEDRSADMRAGTDGWGRDDFPAKIGGRRGNPTDSTTHSGWQDEVAIWLGKALSTEEAISLFDAAVGNTPPPVSGDTNGDGKVDAVDLNVVGINWQMTVDPPGPANGDFDNSGFVDASDLNILGVNWQFGVGQAAATAVPEPNSAACAILSCVLVLGLLRKKYGDK